MYMHGLLRVNILCFNQFMGTKQKTNKQTKKNIITEGVIDFPEA